MRRSCNPPLRQFCGQKVTEGKASTASHPAALICSKFFQRDEASVVVSKSKP